ncbi:laminarinase [Daedaleopsis nitida]|nr:laminarinase [Daedaleopsis nitida]
MLAGRGIVALACIASPVLSATYTHSETFSGNTFLTGFSHQAINDPTHGRVHYVDQDTALSRNLTYASGEHFVIRADDTTYLSSGGPGRDSVRLISNKQYTTHVSLWSLRHMPEGCATWPAVWEVGPNWPNGGEIDIIEGVNNQSPNQASFHTGSGCTMADSRDQTGYNVGGDNCDSAATKNTGCGVKAPSADSFGPPFNQAGGGFYAMERTDAGVKVWFWSRSSGNIPSDVLNGSYEIDTSGWGTPFANYPSTSCNMATHLGPHNIIINLTLCGDWAGDGDVYSSSGCPSDCVTFVNQNPSAFTGAYFDVQWLKVYQ